ncbi:MAG: aminotransferase class I/II-fold pyridoxal phosphate-dependent enzyme [Alphaproteobacteria bacterium]
MQLPRFELERYFARYEFAAEYLLCASDCEAMTVGELLALEPGASEAFAAHGLGYAESAGAPALRAAVTALYETVGPDEVLVHSGAEEAIFVFMHAALAPGDHIIVHSPCYQSLHEVARAIGAGVTPWRADPHDGWSLDPDDLVRALGPRTRAIVLNSPHNPTGYLMDPDRYRRVVAIAEDRGVWLFSDEVYRELEHDPADRLPAACDLSERGVSLGVMSKTYGLAGLRIGWVATHDRDLIARMAALKDYTTICAAAPSEFLARLALAHRHELIERNRGIVLENLDLLDRFFARHAGRFAWARPRAGPIAFPELLDGGAEAFCRRLMERESILLLPGTVYGHGDRHVRVGFGRSGLAPALERLDAYLGA